MTALKFTDRDVRERPELVAEAVRYLRWYQGEFEFLVDAKRYEAANGNLPLPTARGVLNCMRQDTRYGMVVPDLPEPSQLTMADADALFTKKRRLRVVAEEEKRRYPFALKTYWNARLYYSGHKGAVVVHALRLDAELWFYPNYHSGHPIQLHSGMRGLCSQNFSKHTERLAREMPEGKRFCHRCVEIIDEIGYDWGPTIPPTELSQA